MSDVLVMLDIDGVLNSRQWFKRSDRGDKMIEQIDPDACARVQKLCAFTGASLVISSTWRLLHKRPALRRVLSARGLIAPIVGVTPAIPTNEGRGEEIQRWLDVSLPRTGLSPRGMVILDDDQDMLHLSPWLVKTTFETGITDDDVDRAIAVAKSPMPGRKVA